MNSTEFEKYFPQYTEYFQDLDDLARMVEERTKEINITAIRDYDSIWTKHIIDSLIGLEVLENELKPKGMDSDLGVHISPKKVLDLGTGGGFPGLPMAIVKPDFKFVLLDSKKKKIDVVNEFVARLELKNVKTKWARAQELKGLEDSYRFDVVVSRAVAYLPDLMGLALPLLKNNGKMLFYKNLNEEEIKDGIKSHGGDLELLTKREYSLERFLETGVMNHPRSGYELDKELVSGIKESDVDQNDRVILLYKESREYEDDENLLHSKF